jgi:BolA protein
MNRRERIETQIRTALEPIELQVLDESRQHSVPRDAETHFNVMVVAEAFEGMARLERHRRVHELLKEEIAGGLHALTLTLLTPAEHEERGGQALASPECLGGSKAS